MARTIDSIEVEHQIADDKADDEDDDRPHSCRKVLEAPIAALAKVGDLKSAVVVRLQRVGRRAGIEDQVLDPYQQVKERRERGEDEDQPEQCVDDSEELREEGHADDTRGMCQRGA